MTAEEINRRVAEAMGWSGLENADACIAEMFPYPDKHMNLAQLVDATASGWFGWAPGATGPSSVGGEPDDGADKEPTPDYSRDPAAADLVRQEIERRGWGLRMHGAPTTEGTSWYVEIGGKEDEDGRFSSFDSPMSGIRTWTHALCLAFLAACEASKEVE